ARWRPAVGPQARRDPQEPVNPRSAYTMFVKEKMGELGLHIRDTRSTGSKAATRSKWLPDSWRDLPSADKDAYRRPTPRASPEYEARLAPTSRRQSHRLFQEKMALRPTKSAKKLAAPRPGGAPDAQAKSVKQEEGNAAAPAFSSSSAAAVPDAAQLRPVSAQQQQISPVKLESLSQLLPQSQLQQLLPPGTVTLMAVTQPPAASAAAVPVSSPALSTDASPRQCTSMCSSFRNHLEALTARGDCTSSRISLLRPAVPSLPLMTPRRPSVRRCDGRLRLHRGYPGFDDRRVLLHFHQGTCNSLSNSSLQPTAASATAACISLAAAISPQSQSPGMQIAAVSERRDAAGAAPAEKFGPAMSRQMLPRVFLSQPPAERRVQVHLPAEANHAQVLQVPANSLVACYLKPRRNRPPGVQAEFATASVQLARIDSFPAAIRFARCVLRLMRGRSRRATTCCPSAREPAAASTRVVWTPFTFGRSVDASRPARLSAQADVAQRATELIQQPAHRLQSARDGRELFSTGAHSERNPLPKPFGSRLPQAPPQPSLAPPRQRSAQASSPPPSRRPRQPCRRSCCSDILAQRACLDAARSRPTGLHLPQLHHLARDITEFAYTPAGCLRAPCRKSRSARRPPPPTLRRRSAPTRNLSALAPAEAASAALTPCRPFCRLLHRYLMPFLPSRAAEAGATIRRCAPLLRPPPAGRRVHRRVARPLAGPRRHWRCSPVFDRPAPSDDFRVRLFIRHLFLRPSAPTAARLRAFAACLPPARPGAALAAVRHPRGDVRVAGDVARHVPQHGQPAPPKSTPASAALATPCAPSYTDKNARGREFRRAVRKS
uniref:HMG box domain-containing protein n=1 Tax=Macrostomum lignano TaxID=282301 RepID=A0A1I8JQ95_9PLAT